MTAEQRRVIEAAKAWHVEYRASGLAFADLGPAAKELQVSIEALLVAEDPNEAA